MSEAKFHTELISRQNMASLGKIKDKSGKFYLNFDQMRLGMDGTFLFREMDLTPALLVKVDLPPSTMHIKLL